MALLRLALLVSTVLAVSACAEPQNTSSPSCNSTVAIYVVAHDMHTGLVLPRADVPVALWPESQDFPQADYLEIGWGERDYYQGHDQGLRGTLKAALWPTPSVLHIVGDLEAFVLFEVRLLHGWIPSVWFLKNWNFPIIAAHIFSFLTGEAVRVTWIGGQEERNDFVLVTK